MILTKSRNCWSSLVIVRPVVYLFYDLSEDEQEEGASRATAWQCGTLTTANQAGWVSFPPRPTRRGHVKVTEHQAEVSYESPFIPFSRFLASSASGVSAGARFLCHFHCVDLGVCDPRMSSEITSNLHLAWRVAVPLKSSPSILLLNTDRSSEA